MSRASKSSARRMRLDHQRDRPPSPPEGSISSLIVRHNAATRGRRGQRQQRNMVLVLSRDGDVTIDFRVARRVSCTPLGSVFPALTNPLFRQSRVDLPPPTTVQSGKHYPAKYQPTTSCGFKRPGCITPLCRQSHRPRPNRATGNTSSKLHPFTHRAKTLVRSGPTGKRLAT